MNIRNRRKLVITITLLISLLLSLFPLPSWAEALRPDWVALVLIFWCITMPMQIGLMTGLILGFLLDIAMGTLLGQHALGLVLVSFAVIRIHARLRLYPLIQQGFIIMCILFVKQLIFLWIYGMTSRAPNNLWLYFIPTFISLPLWPWFSWSCMISNAASCQITK